VIVGNEAILRGDATVPEIIDYVRRVKAALPSRIQVSVAEPWHVWLAHPELAQAVDFITVHILPYWERLPVDRAMAFFTEKYQAVQAAFPGKHIFVGEVGWPSAGKSFGQATPSLVNEALFLRRFVNYAAEKGIDYNIIEAFDQPWKMGLDGDPVEKHWGIWTAGGKPKFSWIGPVIEFKEWPFQAAAAAFIALLPVAWFLWRWKDLRLPGKIFYGVLVQFAASLVIWTMSTPVIRDVAPTTGLMVGVLLPAQLLLLFVVLISGIELTELTWSGRLKRGFKPLPPDHTRSFPKVSLHLPCYNEPPEMVKLTIDSLMALDYPNLEILVIDNNTKDPAVWQPVKDYCDRLGDKVRFFSLGKWPGAKAGALNFALTRTAADAEIVGVVDSDYLVDPLWLKSLIPYFDDPKVGHVQAPQDHRAWEHDLFKEMINWEYAGFFDIGMVFRNEANAIIQHGTMTLIRKSALEKSGRWAEWCIVEDAELGLRLLRDGYESVYIRDRMGHGLVPDSFLAYKKQRFRWAYGAVQILKAHWRLLLPFRKTGLTPAQKYHFVSGWLPWFADAFYLLFCITSLFWSAGMVLAPRFFATPLAFFTLPTVGVFIAKVVHHLFLYTTRVKCKPRQSILSAIAGMGLTYAIAWAMWQGIATKSTPFLRTPKMADKAAFTQGLMMASEEALLAVLHWVAAAAVLVAPILIDGDYRNYYDPDVRLWSAVLVVQSMPFLAALVTSMISTLPSKRPTKPDSAKIEKAAA
jgi:cellulose synthase/poly-beta-1,6-N-acetylglucosamine synthase-like glycosyltransferase